MSKQPRQPAAVSRAVRALNGAYTRLRELAAHYRDDFDPEFMGELEESTTSLKTFGDALASTDFSAAERARNRRSGHVNPSRKD